MGTSEKGKCGAPCSKLFKHFKMAVESIAPNMACDCRGFISLGVSFQSQMQEIEEILVLSSFKHKTKKPNAEDNQQYLFPSLSSFHQH